MTVKDLLAKFAERVGEDRIIDILNLNKSNEEIWCDYWELHRMVKFLQVASAQLCKTYLEYCETKTFKTIKGKYRLSYFGLNVINVVDIRRNGERVPFKVMSREIVLEEDGEYECEYRAYPELITLDDELNEQLKKYSEAIILSACSFYVLGKEGMFDMFDHFYELYMEEIERVNNETTNID